MFVWNSNLTRWVGFYPPSLTYRMWPHLVALLPLFRGGTYWRQPYPCLEILKEDSQDSEYHCKHGYDVDTSAGKRCRRGPEETRHKLPGSSPSESHRICLIPPASSFDNTCVKGVIYLGSSLGLVPRFLLGAGRRPSLPSTSQDSSLPAGRQVFGIGHAVHTLRAQEPLLTIWGQFYISVGKCSPFKFPDEGEGPVLQTDLF